MLHSSSMKYFFGWFLCGSLLFLVLYLVRLEVVLIPTVSSYTSLALSLLFLFSGFVVTAFSWRKVLAQSGLAIGIGESIASMGLSVFGKYVPGKVWLAVGRAAYIAHKQQRPMVTLSSLSVQEQLIGLWIGLLLGALGLFSVGELQRYGWVILLSWIGLCLAGFSPQVHRMVESLFNMVRPGSRLPTLDLASAVRVMPWILCYWILWGMGFYLLVSALIEFSLTGSVVLAFPLAASLGILAFLAPGGLGVREGVMVGYLVMAGLPLTTATTVSIASRLWFLVGEFVFFMSAVVVHQHQARKTRHG